MTAKLKLTNRNFAYSGYGALFKHRKSDAFRAGGLSPTRPIPPLLQPARTSHVRSYRLLCSLK